MIISFDCMMDRTLEIDRRGKLVYFRKLEAQIGKKESKGKTDNLVIPRGLFWRLSLNNWQHVRKKKKKTY